MCDYRRLVLSPLEVPSVSFYFNKLNALTYLLSAMRWSADTLDMEKITKMKTMKCARDATFLSNQTRYSLSWQHQQKKEHFHVNESDAREANRMSSEKTSFFSPIMLVTIHPSAYKYHIFVRELWVFGLSGKWIRWISVCSVKCLEHHCRCVCDHHVRNFRCPFQIIMIASLSSYFYYRG